MTNYLILLTIILLLGFTSAIQIQDEAVNNVIIYEYNQPAKFDLYISQADPGQYNIYTLTDVSLQPKAPFNLGPGTNKLELYVFPTQSLNERGYYSFSYTLQKESGEKFDDTLTIKIQELKDAIEISSDAINPETGEITFYIKNKENLKLENIKARFKSILFDTEKTFDLEPKEKTYITLDVEDKDLATTTAGSYIIKAEFETDKGTTEVQGRMYLGAKKGITSQEDSSGLIINTKTYTKINSGNTYELVKITSEKNMISRLFTSFNHEPQIVDRQGTKVTYTWNKELEPGEVYVVKVRTNYIFPLIILISAILIILGFTRYVKTNIEVSKSVSPVKTKGGEFALRVNISVKARKNIENASLIDKIPPVVKIYEKFTSMEPTKVDHKNRRIQWDIGELAAGEERSFSYIIYSKVGVVGKFSLPEALVVFEKDEEVHEVFSDRVFWLAEQSGED